MARTRSTTPTRTSPLKRTERNRPLGGRPSGRPASETETTLRRWIESEAARRGVSEAVIVGDIARETGYTRSWIYSLCNRSGTPSMSLLRQLHRITGGAVGLDTF